MQSKWTLMTEIHRTQLKGPKCTPSELQQYREQPHIYHRMHTIQQIIMQHKFPACCNSTTTNTSSNRLFYTPPPLRFIHQLAQRLILIINVMSTTSKWSFLVIPQQYKIFKFKFKYIVWAMQIFKVLLNIFSVHQQEYPHTIQILMSQETAQCIKVLHDLLR